MSPLIGTLTVVWLASGIACALALRWSQHRSPGRILASVLLPIAALAVGILGMTAFRVVASRTVNGQTQWHWDSRWFFAATAALAGFTLVTALWRRLHPAPPAP